MSERFEISKPNDVLALAKHFGGIATAADKRKVHVSFLSDKTLSNFLATMKALATMEFTTEVDPKRELNIFIESEIFNFS